MGGRSAKQPYGALDKASQLDYRGYFKAKAATPVLQAFLLPGDDVTQAGASQLAIVTSSGIDIYRLQSSKLIRQIKSEISLATSGVQRGKEALAYVGADNVVQVAVPALSPPSPIDFTEKVTALRLVPDNFLLVGFVTGEVSIANTNDLGVKHVETGDMRLPVGMFAYTQTRAQGYAIAGYRSEQQSSLYLLPLPDTLAPYSGMFESLPGTCADAAVAENEKLLLALCEETGSVFIWDLENHNYLLSFDLSQQPLSRIMAFEDSNTEGEITLILGGTEGLTVGILRILDGQITWTPRSKSQVQDSGKTRAAAVTSLIWDKGLEMLIMGDAEGQVWLIRGLSTQSNPLKQATAGEAPPQVTN